MKELVLDVETTIFQKGNPFSKQNRLILGGLFDGYSARYFGEAVGSDLDTIDSDALLIGFNIKFDLHWIRRTYGNVFRSCAVWDCQLAEFLLSAQREAFPSLGAVANRRGLGSKLDTISTKYWETGIDTDAVPVEELREYLEQDLKLTWEVYKQQKDELIEKGLFPLFRLQCADLLALEEMEWNGMLVDVSLCKKKEEELKEEIENIDEEIKTYHNQNVPINYGSRDHLSCLLYGGTITDEVRLPIGTYKSGAKIGLPRYKIVEYKYDLPRLITPLKKSELKKDGYYSTDEGTLRQLRGTKKIRRLLQLILRRAEAIKLLGTYYAGLPSLIDKMGWEPRYLHGQFNQCVAVTGRLSSSRPNQQNFAEGVKECLVTRF
jgi:DNA polymerase-1